MKRILSILFIVLLLSSTVYAQMRAIPPAAPSIIRSSDCSFLTWVGTLCHDTDDGKLYKWNGAALVELAAGVTGAPTDAHYFTDQAEAGLSAEVVVTANGKSLITAANYAAMRTLLDLEAGTDFNAYDADLTTYAGITPSANAQTLLAQTFAQMQASLSVDDLITLSGVAEGSVHLATFTGTTINDNVTVKAALQALETAVEAGSGGDITSVLGDATGAVPILYQTPAAFGDADATPDVSAGTVFITANTGATTITDFDAGGGSLLDGQILIVIVNDTNTTFDFTSSGLEGTGADYLAANGETLMFVYSTVDTQWHYLGFPKTLTGIDIGGGTASTAAYWDGSGNLASNGTLDNVPDGILYKKSLAVSANPVLTLQDSDSPGTDKEASQLAAQYIDGADGAENSTLDLNVMQGGTRTSYVQVDGKNQRVNVVKPLTITSMVASGTISGLLPTVTNSDTASYNVTAAQMSAGTFFITTNAATTTYNLPSAVNGYVACFRMGQGNAQVLRIDTDGTDYIVMSTGARTSVAGDYYGATSSASNQVCVVAFDATDYYVTSEIGTWTEE